MYNFKLLELAEWAGSQLLVYRPEMWKVACRFARGITP